MIPGISLEAKCMPVPRTTCEKIRVPYKQNVTEIEYLCKESNGTIIPASKRSTTIMPLSTSNFKQPYFSEEGTFLFPGHGREAILFDIGTQRHCTFPNNGVDLRFDGVGQFFASENKTIGL